MREAVFIKQNLKKWKEYEQRISSSSDQTPDSLADMYTDLTADLAFAQTHYPNSRVCTYLNGMALELHSTIYSGRLEKWSRIRDFWTLEVPRAVYAARREMCASLVVFLIFTVIGVVSTIIDADFPRLIMGDGYVDMTIENIRRGVPTDVYSSGSEVSSFLGITLNNVKVGFLAFTMGIFTCLGTGYIVASNAIMVGAFLMLFDQYGVFGPSALAVMQHGTLELSTIVIEGAAGFVMGNAWLFPGTYSRMQSFLIGAKRGLKITVGVVPIVIMAGFIEGFVTRHVEAPLWLRIGVVVASALFIIYYYVILPVMVHRRDCHEEEAAN